MSRIGRISMYLHLEYVHRTLLASNFKCQKSTTNVHISSELVIWHICTSAFCLVLLRLHFSTVFPLSAFSLTLGSFLISFFPVSPARSAFYLDFSDHFIFIFYIFVIIIICFIVHTVVFVRQGVFLSHYWSISFFLHPFCGSS